MSDYLSRPATFENAINRGGFSSRSAQLTQLITAIKSWTTNAFPAGSKASHDQVRDIANKFDAWKINNPKEFRDRGAALEDDFAEELADAYLSVGLTGDPDGPPDANNVHERFPPAPAVALNRWLQLKKASKLGLTAASAGVSAAQTATHTGMLAAAAGAVIGATGIGLFAGAGAAQVAASSLAIRAAVKTNRHIKGLQDLYDRREQLEDGQHCGEIMDDDGATRQNGWSRTSHDMVANQILPYIIRKKTLKYRRKIITALPILGLGETVRAVAQKARKKINGTLGGNRKTAAQWLACHFIECDCHLTQDIVSELYSAEEMEWLRTKESYDEVAAYLELKMKST